MSNKESNPTTTSLEIAAQVWCEPCFQHIVMDIQTAEEYAQALGLEIEWEKER